MSGSKPAIPVSVGSFHPTDRAGGKPSHTLIAYKRIPLLVIYLLAVFSWFRHPTSFIGDDSYFYLVVARNLVLSGRQTFSGLVPTNGVHPLWLYVLGAYSYVVSRFSPSLLWNARYPVPLAASLLGLGAWNFSKVEDLLGLGPLFTLLPVVFLSVFGLLFSEAHLFYCALSWLTLLVVRAAIARKPLSGLIGFAAALVLLSRLDSVFLVGALYLWWYLAIDRRLLPALRSAGICALIVAPYLISNAVFFGGLVPVHGWMKSTFPHVVLKGLQSPTILSSSFGGYNLFWGYIPLIAGLILLPRLVRLNTPLGIAYVYLLGCLATCLYIMLFVRFGSHWYWYYVEPIILASLTATIFLNHNRPALLAAATLAIGVAGLVALMLLPQHAERAETLVRSVDYVKTHRIDNQLILVSDNPGYLAFNTDDPVLAADLLTTNRRFVDQVETSDNSLRFLQDYCDKLDTPIRWLFYMGNSWLVPSADLRSITYCDPHTHPTCRVIGTIALVPPDYVSSDRNFIVWRLSP
jgi:hypothetical protein